MRYTLPTSVDVGGEEYEIRADYRAALDIIAALSDFELSEQERIIAALDIFYPAFDTMPIEHYQEAIDVCCDFLSCGEQQTNGNKKAVKLMDWEQDFNYIASAVNKVLGREIRAPEFLHWWSFISAYYEIGDCLFAQIVSIRDKKAHGKKLDKAEQEWYRKNRDIVDIKRHYTAAETEALAKLGIK